MISGIISVAVTYEEKWIMPTDYTRGLYRDYEHLLTEHEKLKAEMKVLAMKAALFEKERERREKLERGLEEKNREIEVLKKEVLRLNGILNLDGTNSGIPTSQTLLRKTKVVPNSRKKSEKKIGGQPGHPKHQLAPFEEKEAFYCIYDIQNLPHCTPVVIQLCYMLPVSYPHIYSPRILAPCLFKTLKFSFCGFQAGCSINFFYYVGIYSQKNQMQ